MVLLPLKSCKNLIHYIQHNFVIVLVFIVIVYLMIFYFISFNFILFHSISCYLILFYFILTRNKYICCSDGIFKYNAATKQMNKTLECSFDYSPHCYNHKSLLYHSNTHNRLRLLYFPWRLVCHSLLSSHYSLLITLLSLFCRCLLCNLLCQLAYPTSCSTSSLPPLSLTSFS